MPPRKRGLLDWNVHEPKERCLIPDLIWKAAYPGTVISQHLQQLLHQLQQFADTNTMLVEQNPRSIQNQLPPNPRTPEPASFLHLPPELRHRILFQSAKSDWLRLLQGNMFNFDKVHSSYYQWLSECFSEWEWIMERVCYVGRLDRDVVFVVESWWRALRA